MLPVFATRQEHRELQVSSRESPARLQTQLARGPLSPQVCVVVANAVLHHGGQEGLEWVPSAEEGRMRRLARAHRELQRCLATTHG